VRALAGDSTMISFKSDSFQTIFPAEWSSPMVRPMRDQ
jgi:hypothetical protein